MPPEALLIVAVAVFAYAALDRRLSATVLTAPILFVALGFGLAMAGAGRGEASGVAFDLVAEVSLALVLFADASRTDARALIRAHVWPLRMLALGLPLAIALGLAAGLVLLPGWPLWEAAALAAILAPTDAALGQAVVSNPALPERVRRALTVESGLNDGLALPAVLLFASLAAAEDGAGAGGADWSDWLAFAAAQIGFGAAAGIGAGLAAGRLLAAAIARRLTGEDSEGLAAVAAVAGCYFLAEALGGNAFVACFAGGLAFGDGLNRGRAPGAGPMGGFVGEFLENEGRLLVLGAFLLIGLTLLPGALGRVEAGELALLAVSLFVIRPLAIWISLAGTGAGWRTRLFLGWFGPRGLATALFALLALDRGALAHGDAILALAAVAVGVSALLHGATAAPAARRFGPALAREGGEPPAPPAPPSS
ncbi:MAG: cation:proton antiporter [Pseudomonadota bacterium]|nr:cation:proton antiporter [Pseudomonadota bacterium]MEE3098167.1 cation:proton antiporter [Pseudomonadota bacterium]